MKLGYALCLSTSMLGGAVQAQTFGEGIDSRGYVELSYVTSSGDDDIALSGSFDIFVRPQALGFGSLGLDLGMEGFSADEGGTSKTIFLAGAYYFVGFGKLSVGAPRSAYDEVVTSMHASTFNDYVGRGERFTFASSVSNVAIANNDQTYGLRFDSDVRPLRFFASYNATDRVAGDLESLALATSFTYADLVFAAAYENVTLEGPGDFDNYKAGVTADLGEYYFGVNFASAHIIGSVDYEGWEAFFSYRPTDKIDITATAVDLSTQSDNTYGISGKYSFWNNAYAEIGAVSPASGDEIYEVNLGWDF